MFQLIAFSTMALFLVAGCASKEKSETPAPAPAAKAAPAAPAKAAPTPEPTVAGQVTCKSGKDERILAVTTVEKGCELTYTKFGESKSVASSQSSVEHCEKIRDRIRGNLENAGFQCQ